jgi:hypothetical protein
MHFSSWLWEQLDDPGAMGKFAKLCWNDVNNGCAHAKYSGPQWLTHFEEKHKDRKHLLVPPLINAFQGYMLFLGKK